MICHVISNIFCFLIAYLEQSLGFSFGVELFNYQWSGNLLELFSTASTDKLSSEMFMLWKMLRNSFRINFLLVNFFVLFSDPQGREEGAQIDLWEDPAFEVYHVTDRYGFIQ
jgi:hypothetical protein